MIPSSGTHPHWPPHFCGVYFVIVHFDPCYQIFLFKLGLHLTIRGDSRVGVGIQFADKLTLFLIEELILEEIEELSRMDVLLTKVK